MLTAEVTPRALVARSDTWMRRLEHGLVRKTVALEEKLGCAGEAVLDGLLGGRRHRQASASGRWRGVDLEDGRGNVSAGDPGAGRLPCAGEDLGCRGRQFQGRERAGARVSVAQGLVEARQVGCGAEATVEHAERQDDDSLLQDILGSEAFILGRMHTGLVKDLL